MRPCTPDGEVQTWAFWENTENTFEHILYKRWSSVCFVDADSKSQVLDIKNYQYKLLRGIDFYNFVIGELKKFGNIEWLKDSVKSIDDNDNFATVTTTNGTQFQAKYVFDSTYKLKLDNRKNHNLPK